MLKYHYENKAPVVWIMQGEERLAGVHWSLHEGFSVNAEQFAKKIVNSLNNIDEPIDK
jgi:hypothetical protein